jgi:hypothetical protein
MKTLVIALALAFAVLGGTVSAVSTSPVTACPTNGC